MTLSDLVGFADADFAGYQVDRKSTSGMAHFLGSSLISWGTKKQNSVALSTAEAEYVAVAACCSQLLWIRQHLEDFGIHIKAIPLMCDNTSAVSMGKNPVHHKRTKHIDVRHHFLRDHVEKGNMCSHTVQRRNRLQTSSPRLSARINLREIG